MIMPQSTLMREVASQDRPRERLERYGPQSLKNHELLAILLRTGTKGRSVIDVALDILQNHEQQLNHLARATVDDLRQVKGVGRDKAVTLIAAFTLARRMVEETQQDLLLDTPDAIAAVMREIVRQDAVERFHVLLLNTRRRLIRHQTVSHGTLDTLLVHPREVFRPAIQANASAIVLVHNHPSGDPSPSEADIKVTRDLIRAGQVLKIDVLDHVIMGSRTPERSQDYVSLRELGYFYS